MYGVETECRRGRKENERGEDREVKREGIRESNTGRGRAEGKGVHQHGQTPDHYINIHRIDLGGTVNTHTPAYIHSYAHTSIHHTYTPAYINTHTLTLTLTEIR